MSTSFSTAEIIERVSFISVTGFVDHMLLNVAHAIHCRKVITHSSNLIGPWIMMIYICQKGNEMSYAMRLKLLMYVSSYIFVFGSNTFLAMD